FNKETIKTQIATKANLDLAEKLGNATETFVIDENGYKVPLEKDQAISKNGNSNYTNGDMSGMYKKTTNLLTDFTGTIDESMTKYGTFRITITP
ncbi:MAG: hypothetical protein IJX99_01015, partial [Clostridia bacterium]|nr:hypothetical protein [Clostridia bacterium]